MIIILNDHDYVLYQLYQEPNYAAPSATEIKKKSSNCHPHEALRLSLGPSQSLLTPM